MKKEGQRGEGRRGLTRAGGRFTIRSKRRMNAPKWAKWGKGGRKTQNQEPHTKETINGHKIDQREIEDEVGTLIWSLSLP